MFLEKNWFAMDSIGVNQGLFNSYELIENIAETDSSEYDFIVAVEYFTKNNYQDIAAQFDIIRKAHKSVKINDLGFRDLGNIIKSETIQKKSYPKYTINCTGKQFEILKPFLADWDEYEMNNNKETLIGRLSIKLDGEGCNLSKKFILFGGNFTYLTHGYFDKKENAWMETFTFNNGSYSKWKWVIRGNDIIMENITSSSKTNLQKRNRWTNIKTDSFDIIEERSKDSGKTWTILNITKLKKKGNYST